MGFSFDIKSNGQTFMSFRDAINGSSLYSQIAVMDEVKSYHAKVGILKDKNERKTYKDAEGNTLISTDGNMTVALVGAFQEYGTRTGIPRRSFLRDPILAGKGNINKVASKYLKLALKGEVEAKTVLDYVGKYATGLSRKSFRNNDWQPNADSTIKRKGSSRPLINIGQLAQSIHYEVTKGEAPKDV